MNCFPRDVPFNPKMSPHACDINPPSANYGFYVSFLMTAGIAYSHRFSTNVISHGPVCKIYNIHVGSLQ